MTDISTIRHQSIFDPREHNVPITIIGCGATGSRVFMSLIELGLTKITCFDPDHVEAHNLANQAFLYEHLMLDKVHALRRLYEDKTGQRAPETMHFYPLSLPNFTSTPTGVVFLLTDSFASRREIADACLINNPDVFSVIETRMAATHGNVLQFNPNNPLETEQWQKTLGNDETAEVSACGTSISVGPTAAIIANLAVWQLVNYLTNPEACQARTDVYLRPLLVQQASL